MKQIKYCKCGHSNKEHYKKGYSATLQCLKCKCNEYMDRNMPNIASKILLWLGIFAVGIIVLGIIFFVLTYYFLVQTPEVIIEISNHDLVYLLMVLMTGLFAIGLIMIYFVSIDTYFKEKHRKSYPIEPDEPNTTNQGKVS